MKKVICFAVIIFSCVFVTKATSYVSAAPVMKSVSSSDTLPSTVVSAFKSIFGNVPLKQWKLRNKGQWRVHFLRNGVAW